MKPESPTGLSCPRCAASMQRVRTVPQLGSHPELVTFRCGNCAYVETVEHDPPNSA